MRINGNDFGNTLYQNTVNYDIGISTNVSSTSGGNIKFNTRAVTRMGIDGATGSVGIGNLSPWAPLNIGTVDHPSAGDPEFVITKPVWANKGFSYYMASESRPPLRRYKPDTMPKIF